MDRIIADIIPASRIHYPVIFARLFGAIVCGGLISFEREARDLPGIVPGANVANVSVTVCWSFGTCGRRIVFPDRRRAADGRERLLAFADIDALVRRLADSLPFIFVPDEDLAGHKFDRHMFLILCQN
ncbi:hypothetical protein HFO97_32605 [Rhizobium leguminosarum]|uniref:hypothetical protein n=1 Tax=Rhizobium leguminosarum TaxID=384 RepID=UPI001C9518CF|nr:hypothetical protein [Rhizobium leguminosarum]MBY5364597.1 hypothetical protein [Rhizobium leguminosarum]